MTATTGPTTIEELQRHLAAITAEVRTSGSPEEARAFDYIASELESWGFDVNRYELDAFVGYPVKASLTMVSPEHKSFECNGYSLSPATPESGIEGEIVDAGMGTPADFANIDAHGKIVITDGLATPGKALAAAQSGAIGHIHVNGDRIYEMCISPVWGTPTPETADLLPSVPSVSVKFSTATTIREALKNGPVRVNLSTQPFRGWRKIPVLTADLKGPDDSYVLFSGHVDSWHYGVMDNGTANATQMAVAHLMSQQQDDLKRGLRMAFWSGHSHARYAGSAWYADTFFDDLATNCVCHVNIDSTGAINAIELDSAATMASTYAFGASVLADAGYDLSYHRITRSSDQSFWGHGIPTCFASVSSQKADDSPASAMHNAMFGGGGLGWWWHTTEDTADKIDPDNFKRDADIYADLLQKLLTWDRLPFDPGAELNEIAGALNGYSSPALDLSDLEVRARMLAERANLSSLSDAEANELSVALNRILIPVNFTEKGPFDHDLALPVFPVQGLHEAETLKGLDASSSEYQFLRTKLVRERNRVSAALREADRLLTAAGL